MARSVFVIILLSLAATACGDEPQTTDVAFKADCDGSEQRYVLVLPAGFQADQPHDVLIALHGHGSDRWQFVRDPRDVILSCFQQRFGMNAAMAQFLDLGNAAAYYDQVMSLMEACRTRLPLKVHQVRYEDVVANLEQEARALTAFLDLPFEPSMLEYRETAIARDINTPSARQVIEPLYNRSIERWRRYAAELSPALNTLNQWAARYGYAGG